MLPLRVQGGLVPVPFIVDTGAPSTVYLGAKLVKLLKEMNVLEDILGTEHQYNIMVKGALCHREEEINLLYVCVVPPPHESEVIGTLGHAWCNILGMEAIELLGDNLLAGYGQDGDT